MPNHVDNTVYMKGIGKKDLFIETDDGEINLDFSKILPMPEDLDITSPMPDYAIDLALKSLIIKLGSMPLYQYNGQFKKFIGDVCRMKVDLPKGLQGQEEKLIQSGLKYISNIIKHGYPTWYEWCNDKWGTKWNSYWGDIIDDNCISFVTAWDIPYNIYILLSQQNPYDEITVDWVNEGGCFGRTCFLDGEMIEEKVYTQSDIYDGDGSCENRLFQKVELIEHRGRF